MAGNRNLNEAAKAKNDEFYTQYDDIQKEVNCYTDFDKNVFRDKTILLPCDDPEWSNFTKFFAAKFETFGLKKLISTSYALDSKKIKYGQLTLFETTSPNFNPNITNARGKIFILDRESYKPMTNQCDNLQWRYLDGDGDFRSKEVKALRAEADVIITNPPFSLFREFLKWINPAEKKFLIIGNVNCLTYKEVFPLIKNNKMWIGPSIHSGDRKFYVPDDYPLEAATCGIDDNGRRFINVKGVRWFSNLDHGERHKPLRLMTYDRNKKYSKHKEVKGIGYLKYDNYDAIEVPFTDAIPDDYDGVMGVPITFLDKYCPEQFEIIGHTHSGDTTSETESLRLDSSRRHRAFIGGQQIYDRILIRRRGGA